MGPPPTYVTIGCLRSYKNKTKSVCAYPTKVCHYCITSRKLYEKQLIRAAKNRHYAKISREKAILRYEDLTHENTYLNLSKQKAYEELQEINDMNATTKAEITKLTENLTYYKATRGRNYRRPTTTTTTTTTTNAIPNNLPSPVYPDFQIL